MILFKAKKCKYCREWLVKPREENNGSNLDTTSTDIKPNRSAGQIQAPSNLVNLRKCRHCGKEIAQSATKCPHCGGGGHPGLTSRQHTGIVLLAILIGLFTWFYFQNCSDSSKELKRMEQSIKSSQTAIDEWQMRSKREQEDREYARKYGGGTFMYGDGTRGGDIYGEGPGGGKK